MASIGYASNTYVPSVESTGGMLVGYSRNVDDFPLNQYTKIVPVTKEVGLYTVLTSREAARILSTNDQEHIWADGADMPHGRDELETFGREGYRATRRVYPFSIGDLAVKQADWPILQVHSRVAAQKMMTARTVIAVTTLSSHNWAATGNLLGVNGGVLAKGQGIDNGSRTSPNILKVFNAAANVVFRGTLGAVKQKDLIFVCGPDLARKMAESPEVHEYLAFGPSAMGRLAGNEKEFGVNRYGLPNVMYGYKIVVEDTVRVSSPKNATYSGDTLGYVLGSGEAYMLARPGSLDGIEGAPDYSTIHGFFKEESTVEVKNDPDNRRTQGRIVTHYDYKVVAPQSGVRLTDLLSNDSSGVSF